MPNQAEVAQLIVKDKKFEDWETVRVQHRWLDPYMTFNFTASERDKLPTDWTKLQFKPGDKCTIILGGRLAVTGLILTRQVAYDANNHGVSLTGVGEQWAASQSSIPLEKNNFDGKTLKEAADKALEGHKTKAVAVGTLDERKFPALSSQPGELVFDFVDRMARMRSASIGSDQDGNLLLIGQHSRPIVQQLTEGKNILKMQCVISNDQLATTYSHTGQRSVEDQETMRKTANVQAQAPGSLKDEMFRFLETPAEMPIKEADAQARANYEAIQREGTLITAHVTVQGWLRGSREGQSADLWRAGDNVWVYSPMAMLNLAMKIQTATFTQDNRSGTLTTLELVLPWKLGDKPYGRADPNAEAQAETPVIAPPAPAKNTADTVLGVPVDVTQTQPM